MSTPMRRVWIESPYAGDIAANVEYARACVRDCLKRGEAPIASHLLFTQPGILRDEIPDERRLGMEAGFAWNAHAEACVVYTDRGISRGMRAGMDVAEQFGVPIEERKLEERIYTKADAEALCAIAVAAVKQAGPDSRTRKNAERYEWLREQDVTTLGPALPTFHSGDALDAVVDAARVDARSTSNG